MDEALRRLQRQFDATPEDALADAIDAASDRAGRIDLPLPVLVRVARWRRLAGLVRKWFRRPLADGWTDGVSTAQLEAASARVGRLPRALREAHRLLAQRGDLLPRHGSLIPLDDLRPPKAAVLFVASSVGQRSWFVPQADLHLDDPGTSWLDRADPPLSELCLALTLSGLVHRSELAGHSTHWRDDLAPSVRGGVALAAPTHVEAYETLPVSLPSHDECYRGDADTIVMAGWVRSNGHDYQLVVLTRTEAAWATAIARLGPLLPFDELRHRGRGFTPP